MIATVIGASTLWSCSESEGEVSSKGKANILITDAAVDTENIAGVFISVEEIQAKSSNETQVLVKFDTPVVFDVMAYQNGEVYNLGDGELEVGKYSELRMILSKEEGSSYVLFKDNTTANLDVPSGSSSGYKIKGDFEISSNSTEDIVVDIDLRKALIVTGNGQYKLRPTARLLNSQTTGTIQGTVESVNGMDRLVVYAYASGTYDASEADDPMNDETTRFENSINSAVVKEDGSFALAFMKEGEYEIVVAGYQMNEVKETHEFDSLLGMSITIDSNVASVVEVSANSTSELKLKLLSK